MENTYQEDTKDLTASIEGLVEVPVPELNFNIDRKWHVEIPWYKTSIQGKETFTVFTLRIYYGDVKWTVDKRFSDCLRLSEELERKYEGVPEFPSRQPKFLHDAKFLQTRQRELETYFQQFDQAAYATEDMRNFLNTYTELNTRGITVKPETPKLLEIVPDTIYCTNSIVPMGNGLLLPARMTVIKLRSGNLLLYSPTLFEDALHYALLKLGTVKYILSPNKLHHMFLSEYLVKFPQAKFYAAPGLKERVPELPTCQDINGGELEDEIQQELEYILTTGNSFFSELILYHKSTKILILADFLVNFPPGYWESRVPRGMDILSLTSLVEQYYSEPIDKPMCSSEHAMYCTDSNAFYETIEKIKLWDFQCIIMSHGDIIDNPQMAREALRTACDNVINQVRDRWSITNTVFSFLGSNK